MAFRLGLDCKLYRNTGTYETPVWNEVPNIRDNELALDKDEADVSTRGGGGWEQVVASLKKGSVEFDMVWDTADDDFLAFLTAFLDNSTIEIAAMDGGIAVVGSQGLRATCMVTKCSRKEELKNAVMASVAIKPTYAANAPEWMEIEA